MAWDTIRESVRISVMGCLTYSELKRPKPCVANGC
jgi:hypothetical protein